MKCPYCHQIHSDDLRFCPVTGKPLLPLPSITTNGESLSKICPNCSEINTRNSKTCLKCGFNFNELPPKIPRIKNDSITSRSKKIGRYFFSIIIFIGLISIFAGIIKVFDSPHDNSLVYSENLLQLTPIDNIPAITPVATLFLPTETQISIPTPTSQISTPTALSNFIVKINEIDKAEMVFIPAGDFVMGSDSDSDPYFWGAESPKHTIYVDGYWIYRYEVTNAMYQICDDVDVCSKPKSLSSRTRASYYGNNDFDNYPVIYVTYGDASTYCNWIGGRLPTEAEWERAARGDNGDRIFPWGFTAAEGNQANFCDNGCPERESEPNKEDGFNDTSPVGNYPDGISPYGLYDVSGNVWEWVYDFFNQGFYQVSPEKNPVGPQSSSKRVIRGGGWNNPSSDVRIVQRSGLSPSSNFDTLGFRCVIGGD